VSEALRADAFGGAVEDAAVAPRAIGISDQARYHNDIRRQVLAAHPELSSLNGPDWRTGIAAVGLLAIQLTAAWAVSHTNFWVVFLAAFFFGQFVYHSAATLVHESAHRLVFRNPKMKLAFDLVLEGVLTSFSRQLDYQHNHITSHHPHLGEYATDYEHEDQCRVAARKLYKAQDPRRQRWISAVLLVVNLLPYGFAIDQIFIPRVMAKATGLTRNDDARDTGATKPTRGERWLFFLFSLGVHIGLFLAFGFYGWLYYFWSLSLVLGRWGITSRGQFLAEHPGDDHEAPTRSTYGWGNLFFFNTGYHFEHHSFPNVAWTRLPQLKKAAPDVFKYANSRSYFRFWWDQVKSDFTLPSRPSSDISQAPARCVTAAKA